MYYHGFDKKFPSGKNPWTHGDDQLVGLLFSKIITRTARVEAQAQARADADAPSPAPVAGVQAQPDPAQAEDSTGASADGAFGAWTGGGADSQGNQTPGATLRQAMRQATQAYLACARSFACPRPMLQAVA